MSIYSNDVWHETTLAGNDGREMAQFIFGDLDVPALDEDTSPVPPFDLSRSMRLNGENELVRSIYAFVGQKVDLVRRELVDRDKKERATQEARLLAEQANEIAKLLNEDFNEFRQKLAKVRASAAGGADLHDDRETGDLDQAIIFGSELPADVVDPTGGPGRGEAVDVITCGGPPPDLAPRVEPSEGSSNRGRATGGASRQKPRGGFDVKFEGMGHESPRAQYVRDQRTIFINLDHPQLVAARGLASIEESAFRRLSYEVAFSEYAIALASELSRSRRVPRPFGPDR